MNGCGAWQSPMRLPTHRPSRSAGRSQERPQPAAVSERTLDGGPARRLSDALRISDNGRPILTVRSSTKFYTLANKRLNKQLKHELFLNPALVERRKKERSKIHDLKLPFTCDLDVLLVITSCLPGGLSRFCKRTGLE